MGSVLNIIAPIFAGLCVLGAFYLIIRGLRSRSVPQTSYGVAKVEARQSMLVSFLGAVFLLILGGVIFAIYGVFSIDFFTDNLGGDAGATFTPSPTVMVTVVPTQGTLEPVGNPPTVGATNTPVELDNLATFTPTPDPPTVTPTPSITPTPEPPTPTSTPDIDTAVVNSPNGLYLREAPGGTQEVELIPDGTILIVLEGREVVDDLEWQQVQTPAGNVGWVAVDFIIYQ